MIARICLAAVLVLAGTINVHGQSTPVAAELNASRIPQQVGLKITTADNSKYPVLAYRGLLFVAYSREEKPNSMIIVGYDKSEKPQVLFAKDGTDRLKRITVDPSGKAVHFVGQNNQEIVVPWSQLVSDSRTPSKHVSVSRKSGRHQTERPQVAAKPKGLSGKLPPGLPKGFDKMLREMKGKNADWAKLEKMVKKATRGGNTSGAGAKGPIINPEDTKALSEMAKMLDRDLIEKLMTGGVADSIVEDTGLASQIDPKVIEQIRSTLGGAKGGKSAMKLDKLDRILSGLKNAGK